MSNGARIPRLGLGVTPSRRTTQGQRPFGLSLVRDLIHGHRLKAETRVHPANLLARRRELLVHSLGNPTHGPYASVSPVSQTCAA